MFEHNLIRFRTHPRTREDVLTSANNYPLEQKMLWLVLQVLFYILVSLNHLNASEITNPAFDSSDNHEIEFIHNVQPLKNAETINWNILKAAVRQKLREIFAIQFPNGKYSTRNYDIENWPEGIESRGSVNWRKDELIRINERIPILKFIPRETAAKVDSDRKIIYQHLKNMECLKSASLSNQMKCHQTKKLMLDRFRIESGKTDASSIDWRLLDRRQIPLKYKDVPLKTTTLTCKLIFQNAEIVDNIHFFKYANLNDSNQASDNESTLSADEVDVTEETNPLNEQVDISRSEDDASINSDEFEIDAQLSLFDESLNDFGFDIKQQDLERIFDDCHSKDTVSKLEIKLSRHQINVIHKTELRKLRTIVRTDLNKLFNAQIPDEEFKMANYEIRNWPEGVGLNWNLWTKAQITKIYEKKSEFVFVKRTNRLPIKPSNGIRQSGSLIGILDNLMTYEGTHETLLNRFRQESGESNAVKIDWKLLDRRDIPAKYDDLVFSKFNLSLKSFYKNPEIVNNIHFFNPNELKKVSHKRKSEELENNNHLEDFN